MQMGDGWRGPLNKIDGFRYEIPRSYKPAMRTNGIIFIDEPMVAQLRQDQAPEQVANVATMPEIVGQAMAMPDIHWGYGFPIGGVAAFDYDEGVISPGGIGYDLNCLSGEARVLTAHGYRLPIARFERTWRHTSLACVNPRHRTTRTDVAAYMRFNASTAYRVRTSLGVEITATGDHPFLTPDGMVPLREVGNRPVAVYPFRGVDYEEPSAQTLLNEEGVAGSLSPNQTAQILPFLRRKGLLPLTPRHPSFPYLLKLFGLAVGDGHASLLTKTAGIAFWGRREDLEDVRKDLARLGWSSRIYTRKRAHAITHSGRRYTFEYEEASLRVSSTALAAVLHALGLPVGNKAKQDFTLPESLLRAPLWHKRLFLAALVAAEMSAPKTLTGHGYNFYCPTFSLSKREGFQDSGRVFAEQVRRLVMDFGVRVHRLTSDVLKVPGSVERSYRFKVLIAGDSENLIRFYSTVNFEYHAEKRYLANAAAFYLTLKEMVLRETHRSARIAKDMRTRGVPWDEILENLAGLYTRRASLVHRSNGRVGKPRAWKPFPTFPEFLERLRSTGGTSGVVWDRIAMIEEVPVGEVYDFTVADRHHNFIADGFVVSNCGVRLLRTRLTEAEVRPGLRPASSGRHGDRRRRDGLRHDPYGVEGLRSPDRDRLHRALRARGQTGEDRAPGPPACLCPDRIEGRAGLLEGDVLRSELRLEQPTAHHVRRAERLLESPQPVGRGS